MWLLYLRQVLGFYSKHHFIVCSCIKVVENSCTMYFIYYFCLFLASFMWIKSVQVVSFFNHCLTKVDSTPTMCEWMVESVCLPLNADLEVILVDWSFSTVQSSLLHCATDLWLRSSSLLLLILSWNTFYLTKHLRWQTLDYLSCKREPYRPLFRYLARY